jgi:hypothetical protein
MRFITLAAFHCNVRRVRLRMAIVERRGRLNTTLSRRSQFYEADIDSRSPDPPLKLLTDFLESQSLSTFTGRACRRLTAAQRCTLP